MNEITVFNNDEFGSVRTVMVNNEPWFVGKDIANALGYERDTKAVVDHVDDDDRKMLDGKTQSCFGIELGQRGGWIINESGVYSLIMSSNLPNAKKFKRWVTSEVLPSIRKTGSYGKPMSQLEIAQYSLNLLLEQERKLKAVEAQQGEQVKRLDIIDSRLEVLNGVHIEGTGRDRLNAMVRAYVVKKGISYADGWKDFKKAFNRAFHTCLGALLTNYTKKNNLRSKPTIPRFLEKTNRLDDGLRVAEKMLNELT